MYEAFYGLKGKPFQLNPDPRFFFKSRSHQRAMAYLRYGLQQEQGFIVVTGDIGTGKTMLVHNLFRELDRDRVVAAKVVSTNVEELDLLRLVAADLGLKARGSKGTLLAALENHFRDAVKEGKRVLLVVDEAQNLPRGSLEELRMLSNFVHEEQPLVQSFLLGQREFRETLRSPGLEQLRQRVIAAFHLKPLAENEVRDYIVHRLRTVGWHDRPVFDDEVFGGIHAFTRGVPRRINTLMDRLLLHGALEERERLGVGDLTTVTGEIDSEQGWDTSADAAPHEDGQNPGEAQRSKESQAEIERLERRLAQMQRTVEQLHVRLQAPHPQTVPPFRGLEAERRVPVWSIAFGVAVVLIVVVGAAFAYLLLNRGAA